MVIKASYKTAFYSDHTKIPFTVAYLFKMLTSEIYTALSKTTPPPPFNSFVIHVCCTNPWSVHFFLCMQSVLNYSRFILCVPNRAYQQGSQDLAAGYFHQLKESLPPAEISPKTKNWSTFELARSKKLAELVNYSAQFFSATSLVYACDVIAAILAYRYKRIITPIFLPLPLSFWVLSSTGLSTYVLLGFGLNKHEA